MELPLGVCGIGTDLLLLGWTDTVNVIQNEYFSWRMKRDLHALYNVHTGWLEWGWGGVQSRNIRWPRDLQSQKLTFGTHLLESRKSDAVEMDEMMAAMVLTSLSCSPVVQSPPGVEANFSGEEGSPCGFWVTDFLCFEQRAWQEDFRVSSHLHPRLAEWHWVRCFHSVSSVSSSGEKFPGALWRWLSTGLSHTGHLSKFFYGSKWVRHFGGGLNRPVEEYLVHTGRNLLNDPLVASGGSCPHSKCLIQPYKLVWAYRPKTWNKRAKVWNKSNCFVQSDSMTSQQIYKLKETSVTPQSTLSVTWEETGLLDISNLMRLVVNLKVFFGIHYRAGLTYSQGITFSLVRSNRIASCLKAYRKMWS